ncbi:hypothetical protein [Sciscionella sediminilitoris]|uniref:hypothetical protein n=1 Tax=Sciscionella sediminilitoris TaxID=1445613 RepID=UPI0012E30C7E|nr:hypothetical protein [Sciscionella sp. SE31]
MTYPPQPPNYGQSGGFQPMPQHPVQIDPQTRPPSGGTAITAGVLGLLGGLFGLYMLISVVSVLGQAPSSVMGILVGETIGFVLWTGTLIAGPILLFMRKRLGQILTLIGSGLAIIGWIALGVLAMQGVAAVGATFNGSTSRAAGAIVGVLFLFAVPAIATFVLAIVPLTTRYVTWQRGQGAMYGGMPQQPPYPPVGGQQPW